MRRNYSKYSFIVLSFVIPILLSSLGSSKAIDCKKDFDCFLQNSVNCKLSNLQYTSTINLFGMNITSESLLKIRPYKDKCELYINNRNIKVKFIEELKQNLLSEGYTSKEISRLEKKANVEARKNKGILICRFNSTDLTTTLTRWNNGSFSTEDIDVAECKGKLFSTNQVMH